MEWPSHHPEPQAIHLAILPVNLGHHGHALLMKRQGKVTDGLAARKSRSDELSEGLRYHGRAGWKFDVQAICFYLGILECCWFLHLFYIRKFLKAEFLFKQSARPFHSITLERLTDRIAFEIYLTSNYVKVMRRAIEMTPDRPEGPFVPLFAHQPHGGLEHFLISRVFTWRKSAY